MRHVILCLQQTCCEPRHVANRAVHEELLDDLLVREDLAEPDAQLDVALQCFADDSNEEGDLSSHTRPECHSQGESDDIFKHFQLVTLSTSLEDDLQIAGLGNGILLVRLERTIPKYLE